MSTFLVFSPHRLPVPRLVDVVAEEVRGDVGPLAPAPAAEGGGDGPRRNSQGEQEEADHRFSPLSLVDPWIPTGMWVAPRAPFLCLGGEPSQQAGMCSKEKEESGTRYGEEEVKGFFCASTL